MKHILVHLDASPRAAVRLALAQQLARQHGARVTTLYGVLPTLVSSPWLAAEVSGSAAALLADLDRTQRERALACYAQAASRAPLDWVDGGDAPAWSLLQHALYADLVVLGQADPDDGLSGPLPPDLLPGTLLDSGRPTLLVPKVGVPEALPQRVLVAWKPSRESARAVIAALPWLRQAQAVHLAVQSDPDDGNLRRGPALAQWLQLHGIASVQVHELGSGHVGESLLSMATDHGAGLLVMGGYGHSRAREWVLGGATRTILQSMTLPVLMVH